jgi:hypothetical protein
MYQVEGEARQAHLLSETDARPGVEGQELERVLEEVLLKALVKEALRGEFLRWRNAGSLVRVSDIYLAGGH